MKTEKLSIPVSASIGEVSAELTTDTQLRRLYVFAHGAGADMHHPFMVKLAYALADFGIGTLRYNFPFKEKGGRRPDPPAVAGLTVQRAIATAAERFPTVPLLAGGKSFGGRMTSQALSKSEQSAVSGIVFTGFPLHPAGNPGKERAMHLSMLRIPMLFLQGTRDALADMKLMEEVCSGLPQATLVPVPGADHSFKAGKNDLISLLAEAIHQWSSKM